MKAQTNRLTFSQQFFIATMLFGLFFGAGNLIFPIFLGSQAGRNVWPAITGLLITGVGIPLLGVAAQGISRSNGLQEMAGRVSPRYSIFFTCAVPDHRSLLRHSPLRLHVFHRGHRAAAG